MLINYGNFYFGYYEKLDNMYHLLHDDLQCPYPVRKYEINKGGVFDF